MERVITIILNRNYNVKQTKTLETMTNDIKIKKYENKGFKFSVCPNNGNTTFFAKRNGTYTGTSWTNLLKKLPNLKDIN